MFKRHLLIRMIKQAIRQHKPFVVLLNGDIGAGKTTFVSKILKKIVSAQITSPTFTIINQYSNNIFHIDLYRIKDEKELQNTDFYEIIHGDNVVFIEHPYNCVHASEYKNIKYGLSIDLWIDKKGKHHVKIG